MRVIFASAAYLTAMAGGVNILIASAHSLASLATPMLQLPAAKQSSAPTLVEAQAHRAVCAGARERAATHRCGVCRS